MISSNTSISHLIVAMFALGNLVTAFAFQLASSSHFRPHGNANANANANAIKNMYRTSTRQNHLHRPLSRPALMLRYRNKEFGEGVETVDATSVEVNTDVNLSVKADDPAISVSVQAPSSQVASASASTAVLNDTNTSTSTGTARKTDTLTSSTTTADAPPKPKKKSRVTRVVQSTIGTNKSSNSVRTLASLDEFLACKDKSAKENKLMIVRFFSHWCKACKAMEPMYKRLARRNPQATFIQIPISRETEEIRAALDIVAVPFGHIYHPTGGLMEELNMGKKFWSDFEDIFYRYTKGGCEVGGEEFGYLDPIDAIRNRRRLPL